MPYAPERKEQEWIESSQEPGEAAVCVQLAAGANLLNPFLIIDVLADDCTYTSQSVLETMEGKQAIAEYLTVKFDTIRRAGPGREAKWELAFEPQLGSPCVLVHQRDSAYGAPGIGRPLGYWSIGTLQDGKIGSLLMVTAVPSPHGCRRSGLFPGLTGEQVKAAMEFPGKKLPRTEDVALILFTLGRPNLPMDEMMKERVETVVREFRPLRLRLCTMADSELGMQYNVKCFPTLVIVCRGEVVKTIEGACPEDALREELRTLLRPESR